MVLYQCLILGYKKEFACFSEINLASLPFWKILEVFTNILKTFEDFFLSLYVPNISSGPGIGNGEDLGCSNQSIS